MSKELVQLVTEVRCEIFKRFPPLLHIRAKGNVNTGGWTDPELRFSEIKDGTVYFDFVAKPPEGPATQEIAEIRCNGTFDVLEPGVHRVVIRSKDGSEECVLSKPEFSKNSSVAVIPKPCVILNGSVKGIDIEGAIEDAIKDIPKDNKSRSFEIVEQKIQTGGITGTMTFVSVLMC